MGPNGQAQYWARDLAGACRHPARATTSTPTSLPVSGSRAVRARPTRRSATSARPSTTPRAPTLRRVADMFSDRTNPGRKQPFDIRSVMRAVIDCDQRPLERWAAMRAAEIAVVWDAHLGGWPVWLIGIESRPLPRHGPIPADGPEQWTSGTLFPRSSKKIARAINAAAGRRTGGRARQPRRVRWLARVDARVAARVRRRDRHERSSTSTVRSCSASSRATTAGRSSSSRRS